MKRLFLISLVFLLIPFLFISVSAAEVKAPANMVDLMSMGYFEVRGEVVDGFQFTTSGNDNIVFPVDVSGGCGYMEFVIQTNDPSLAVVHTESGEVFTKVAMPLSNTYYFYSSFGFGRNERITLQGSQLKTVRFLSAYGRSGYELTTPLLFDGYLRIGANWKVVEETEVARFAHSAKMIEVWKDPDTYTTWVEGRVTVNPDKLYGLDYVDLSLNTIGFSINSISARTASGLYLPLETSSAVYETTDPAYERNNFNVRIDISSLSPGDGFTVYVFGVCASSAPSFWFTVNQVVGGVTQPETSGVVGLLYNIWQTLKSYVSGDEYYDGSFPDDVIPLESEVDEMVDEMETSPTINVDDITGELDNLTEFETDENFVDAIGYFFDGHFLTVITMAISFGILGYILYGKR